MTNRDPSIIKNVDARRKVEKGLGFKRGIDEMVEGLPESTKENLKQMLLDLDSWTQLMFKLAAVIDGAENNPVLSEDRHKLPRDIIVLKLAVVIERDTAKKVQLQTALNKRLSMRRDLRIIDNNVRETKTKLKEMLGHLEKVHKFVLAIDQKSRSDK